MTRKKPKRKPKKKQCPHDATERQGGMVCCADCFKILSGGEEPA